MITNSGQRARSTITPTQKDKTVSIKPITSANYFRSDYWRSLSRVAVEWMLSQSIAPLKLLRLEDLIAEAQDVSLSLGEYTWGETSFADLVALCTLVRLQKPKTIFEFGTYTGHATLNMIMNSPLSSKIITLELPPGRRRMIDGLDWEREIDESIIGRRCLNSQYADRIISIFADSRELDISSYVGKVDFVYVDGCHEREFVRNDSVKAFQMLSRGGMIVWHDRSWMCPEVDKYLRELAQTCPVYWIRGTRLAFCTLRESFTT